MHSGWIVILVMLVMAIVMVITGYQSDHDADDTDIDQSFLNRINFSLYSFASSKCFRPVPNWKGISAVTVAKTNS